MYPSRYMTINEKSPYPVKRRVRGRGSDGENKPAITLLPTDSYTIVDSPELSWLPSPRVYRTVAPKSAKNREASSFVILGDTHCSPVHSRPASPAGGRISPFRGHGFKSPTTTRPNSRATSPGSSPKKGILVKRESREKFSENSLKNRKDFNRYIGLPPKSPIGGKKTMMPMTAGATVKPERSEISDTDIITAEIPVQNDQKGFKKTSADDICARVQPEEIKKDPVEEIKTETTERMTENEDVSCCGLKMEENSDLAEKLDLIVKALEEEKALFESTEPPEKIMPQEFYRKEYFNRSCPNTPTSKSKSNSAKKESNFQIRDKSAKVTSKPPLPPRKIGLKPSLKSNENRNQPRNRSGKITVRGKSGVSREQESLNYPCKNVGENFNSQREQQQPQPKYSSNGSLKSIEKNEQTRDAMRTEIDTSKMTLLQDSEFNGAKRFGEVVPESKKSEIEKIKIDLGSETDKKFQSSKKLVPCYQPDKCHIAPPTMASPSPSSVITPSMSTPPTSTDLALSSVKNSQSISAAPTTVTSSSLSSVSTAVVLSGNLARKENSAKTKGSANLHESSNNGHNALKKENQSDPVKANGTVLVTEKKSSTDMVKAGNKHLKKDNLSEDVKSAAGVIKAQPETEVLSPNNLRNSPPRMSPPNVAWDNGRLPNGNVSTSTRATPDSKFQRFLSALCKFLRCIFCCRCFASRCCRRKSKSAVADASSSAKKCCGNPFKCLLCPCTKPKCCQGSTCCRGKSKVKTKPAPQKSDKGKCCAKPKCSLTNCCARVKARCLVFREKINSFCRCLFCINLICCQNLLKKCKCCHKLKCCQSNGCCSCCNPYVKLDPNKLIKKTSRVSSNSQDDNQLDQVLVEHTSRMKAAIPVLPTCLAVFCLICNTFVPGLGTVLSGLLCLCFGKPRFSTKDNPINRLKSFIINIIIGVAQAFTVVFCLVGWGWSVWWGVIMYKLSRRQKRLKMAEQTQKEAGSSNVNQNHVDIAQG